VARVLCVVAVAGMLGGCAASAASTGTVRPDGAAVGGGETGLASWYGERFRGRRTASGEVFDPDRLTAAHRTLPFGTRCRVTNLANGRSVVLRVNDRGPASRRIVIDVSRAAAQRLGFIVQGHTRVIVEVLP
jgi:rare lipoprotein A